MGVAVSSPLATDRTIDPEEIAHFSKDSARWWDEDGPFAPLHRLNPVRMGFVRDRIAEAFGRGSDSLHPFEGLKILDIGCGGGLVCEALARLGAEVTGIDADSGAVACARDHAAGAGLSINYESTSAEDLLARKGPGKFDAVLALEIAEHVRDPAAFVACCAGLVRPGGVLVVSTLNRTPKSFLLGIVAAEYILGWVPRGTHRWRKFIRPSEFAAMARRVGLSLCAQTGLIFDPRLRGFRLSQTDLDVNYFLCFQKGAL
ncbi:MAG: bifunctional 2-polyprenyl-6-hydroxyphenol methylase/3-demethylubiquinol 3-O-methyltransferase UbiG [Rhodospirillales bacterium]|nr:bifunctional 2-polyprenyl-6-hydroxyphenol methylase/3-demethylubiquinol 3-O-methyltransferase UbiG [Rhodospirillales bacterium]